MGDQPFFLGEKIKKQFNTEDEIIALKRQITILKEERERDVKCRSEILRRMKSLEDFCANYGWVNK